MGDVQVCLGFFFWIFCFCLILTFYTVVIFTVFFQRSTVDMDIVKINAWDATKEMVDEERVLTIFIDPIQIDSSLGIPEERIAREAPEHKGSAFA